MCFTANTATGDANTPRGGEGDRAAAGSPWKKSRGPVAVKMHFRWRTGTLGNADLQVGTARLRRANAYLLHTGMATGV